MTSLVSWLSRVRLDWGPGTCPSALFDMYEWGPCCPLRLSPRKARCLCCSTDQGTQGLRGESAEKTSLEGPWAQGRLWEGQVASPELRGEGEGRRSRWERTTPRWPPSPAPGASWSPRVRQALGWRTETAAPHPTPTPVHKGAPWHPGRGQLGIKGPAECGAGSPAGRGPGRGHLGDSRVILLFGAPLGLTPWPLN